ncbi:hypothetical protein J6590_006673 [Homalodisca vitripennis]|nr:hypothetical protein J6590_006673 [Homalodisca vitripennis]
MALALEISSSKIVLNKLKMLARSIYTPGHILNASRICQDKGANLTLLIVVTSDISHTNERADVRRTWGQLGTEQGVAIVFSVGKTDSSYISRKIIEEEHTYGDIIQGNFIDVYDNLSLKTLSFLEWVNNYCSKVKFVLKTYDDTFINVPLILQLGTQHLDSPRSIFGKQAKNIMPVRDMFSKYYLSQEDFSSDTLPDFMSGGAYMMSADITSELYNHALDTAFFKLEDVFFTGIVAKMLNISQVNVEEFVKENVVFDECEVKYAYVINNLKHREKLFYWKLFLEKTPLWCKWSHETVPTEYWGEIITSKSYL